MNYGPGIGNMTLYGLEKAAVSAVTGRIRGKSDTLTISLSPETPGRCWEKIKFRHPYYFTFANIVAAASRC